MSQDLNEVMKDLFRFKISHTHTVLPARVIDYDPEQQKVTVEPTIVTKLRDGREFQIPAITKVPVVFPSTNNSLISFPLAKGDEVLVVFCERSLDEFLASDTNTPLAPADRRMFELTDAIAIPGLYGFKRNPNSVTKHSLPHDQADTVIKHNLGTSKENEVRLKATGNIEVTAGTTKITVNLDGDIAITTTGQVTTDADVIVTGGDVVADGISLKSHTHTQGTDSRGDSQVDTGPAQ